MNPFILVTLIVLFHFFVLSSVNFFPYPELFVYPYLSEKGFLPYRQIFDQHLPSLLMTAFNLSDLGLRDEASARLYLLGTVVVTHILIYLIARQIFRNKRKAFVVNLFYFLSQPLFEGNFLWLDSFLAPILLLAFYTSLRFSDKRQVRYALLLGVFLGLLLFFKQAMFPLVFFVILLLYWKTRNLKALFLLILMSLIPVGITLIWLYKNQIWQEFLYWTISFNFEVYASMARKLPTLTQIVRFFIFWLPPTFWFFVKRKKTRYILLGSFAVFSLSTAFPRFEFVHLQPSLAFIILGWGGIYLSKLKRKSIYLMFFLLVLASWWPIFLKKNFHKKSSLFTQETLEVAKSVDRLTGNNERIFVLGAQPIIYPLSNRLPAGGVFSVNVPWNMLVSQDLIYEALLKDPPKVVIMDKSASVDEQKVIDFSPKLNEFVDENYQVFTKIGTNEILIQK